MVNKEKIISQKKFSKSDYERFIIVSDIGGTNTHIAIMGTKNSKSYDIIIKHDYQTKEISKIEDILNDVLKEAKEDYDIEIKIACIGAAGPISRKRSYIKLTNIDLEVNTKDLLAKTMLNKVIIINDFEAVGYGLDLLDLKKDVINLKHAGEDLTEGNIGTNTFAVFGAGTGLGMSIAPYCTIRHLHTPLPSEGGHIDFSAQNKVEMDLVEFLKKSALTKKSIYPELERILSGKGMENIFNFLVSKKKIKNKLLKDLKKLEGHEKLNKIAANYDKNSTCKKTVDMFINIYARTARTLALVSECYSGLFIVGNVALDYIERFKEKKFMEEFEKHDKRSDILRKVPVYLITNRDVGLYGCCNVAINFFNIM